MSSRVIYVTTGAARRQIRRESVTARGSVAVASTMAALFHCTCSPRPMLTKGGHNLLPAQVSVRSHPCKFADVDIPARAPTRRRAAPLVQSRLGYYTQPPAGRVSSLAPLG